MSTRPDGGGALLPSPDLGTLVGRYVPARSCGRCRVREAVDCPAFASLGGSGAPPSALPCDRFRWDVSLDDYEAAGLELQELAGHAEQVTGLLADFGWRELVPQARADGRECTLDGEPIRTESQWIDFLARLWHVSRTTIVKALQVARSPLQPPEDMSMSMRYEIESATDDPAEKDRLMELVLARGWNTWQLKTAKWLRREGYTRDWDLPRLVADVRAGVLLLERDGRTVPVARLMEAGGDGECALALLSRGLGVTVRRR